MEDLVPRERPPLLCDQHWDGRLQMAVKLERQTRVEQRSYTGRQSEVAWLEVFPLEHVHLLQVTGETQLLHHDLQSPAGEREGEHDDPVHHDRVRVV